jgi:hypothetical protein
VGLELGSWIGRPDWSRISTSHIERANLNVCTHLRRLTRLKNVFIKKLGNHKAAITLHIAFYNFCRVHQTLGATPAMKAGLRDDLGRLRTFLVPKVGILLLIFLSSECSATTAVIVVTPKLIVGGSDRMLQMEEGAARHTSRVVTTKIFLVGGRFIVGAVGIEYFHTTKPAGTYEFPEWIKGIESQVSFTTSVFDLVGIIEKESTIAFTKTVPIEQLMKSGAIKHTERFDKSLVHYVVAGFENGIATLIEIDYKLDWKGRHLIGPKRTIRSPRPDIRKSDNGLHVFGKACEVGQLTKPNSFVRKRLDVSTLATIGRINSGNETSVNVITFAIRALIGVEAEVYPTKVGMGETIVSLPLVGPGTMANYPAFVLPKTAIPKQRIAEKDCGEM